MGNQDIPASFQKQQFKNLFFFHCVIGRGGFGKVWKVTYKKTNQVFALKQMSKVKIIDKKSEKSVMFEKQILSQLTNPFIVNMKYSFQDKHHLYLILDYFQGGDLRYHLCKYKTFSEAQTKFYIACMVTALHYIHNKNIMHRDLKPENLMLDSIGYIHITDFGVARNYHRNNKSETSGTPGYMAPEVLCGKNHNYMVDYYAIGVIGYECMFGYRPYNGNSRKEIREEVLAKQVSISKCELPRDWSWESMDFINKLLVRKWSQRLGKGGIEDIKKHSWFKGFDWERLNRFEMEAPFIPENKDNYDKYYCNKKEVVGEETLERYSIYKDSELYYNAFYNYTCNHLKDDQNKSKQDINNNINNGDSSVSTSSTIKNNSLHSSSKKIKFRIRNSLLNQDNSSLCSVSLKRLKILNQNISNSKFISPHPTIIADQNNIKDKNNENKEQLPIINHQLIRKRIKKSASVNDLMTSLSPVGRNDGGNMVTARASIKYSFHKVNKNMNCTLFTPHKNFLAIHKKCADLINSHNNSNNLFVYNSNNNSINNLSNIKNNSTRLLIHYSPLNNSSLIKNKEVKILNKRKFRLK